MIDPHVMKAGYVERVVRSVAVSVDNAVRLYFTGDNGNERIGFGIFDGERKKTDSIEY